PRSGRGRGVSHGYGRGAGMRREHTAIRGGGGTPPVPGGAPPPPPPLTPLPLPRPPPLSPRDLGRLLTAGRQVNGIRAGAAELAATAAELAVAEDVGGAEATESSGLAGLRSITDAAEFDAVLAEGVPVLVQLTATWCGPCRHLRPILERVVAGFSGRITGVVVDIDRSPWAERFDARSVPTVIAFAGGREVLRFVGVRSERDITALLGAAVELDRS
ncbi:thioredoxin family protein, partial [Nocardia otitidiscaviarum]|uniref:thioredoxin family protein n=1 Tax=Nocardia otitidiscaviarum TaxID=1823 RepID=UPI002453CF50